MDNLAFFIRPSHRAHFVSSSPGVGRSAFPRFGPSGPSGPSLVEGDTKECRRPSSTDQQQRRSPLGLWTIPRFCGIHSVRKVEDNRICVRICVLHSDLGSRAMALVAGRFGISASSSTAAALVSSSSSSSSTSGQAAPAELVRLGISSRRCCTVTVSKWLVGPVVAEARPIRCRAVATNYLEEESQVLDLENDEEEKKKKKKKKEVNGKEEQVSHLIPSAFEVQNLLMQVCDETSNIAEVQLKVGSFSLKVRRDIGKPAPSPKPVAPGPPVLGKAMVESIPAESVPAAPKPTKLAKLSIARSRPISNFSLMEDAAGAGILFITSPKVGLFRKGRTVKGKSGPPLCEEGQLVQKGKVICYLEQLGTQQPVEADITGEVEKILWEDGEPVGYGDPLIAIRPAFPGIKVKGQLSG